MIVLRRRLVARLGLIAVLSTHTAAADTFDGRGASLPTMPSGPQGSSGGYSSGGGGGGGGAGTVGPLWGSASSTGHYRVSRPAPPPPPSETVAAPFSAHAVFIAQAVRALGAQQWDIAFSALHAALADDPTDVSARNTLGWLLLRAGRFDEAESELRQALLIRRDPSSEALLAAVLASKGRDLLQHERATEAAALFEGASRLVPTDPTVQVFLGAAHKFVDDSQAQRAAVAGATGSCPFLICSNPATIRVEPLSDSPAAGGDPVHDPVKELQAAATLGERAGRLSAEGQSMEARKVFDTPGTGDANAVPIRFVPPRGLVVPPERAAELKPLTDGRDTANQRAAEHEEAARKLREQYDEASPAERESIAVRISVEKNEASKEHALANYFDFSIGARLTGAPSPPSVAVPSSVPPPAPPPTSGSANGPPPLPPLPPSAIGLPLPAAPPTSSR